MEQCRYCWEEDPPSKLITPCNCSGSQKFIHQQCLNRWLRFKSLSGLPTERCPTCNGPLQGVATPTWHKAWAKLRTCLILIATVSLPCVLYFLMIMTRHLVVIEVLLTQTEAGLKLGFVQYGSPLPNFTAPVIIAAEPAITGSIFKDSVLLILKYSYREGALGFIINRPDGRGGPVNRFSLHLLHNDEAVGGDEIVPGLFYVKGDSTVLPRPKETRWRQLTGYAAWGPGQLDGEFQAGSWRVVGNVTVNAVL